MISIHSTELSRLLFNALLFAQENSFIGGVALFALDSNKLEMSASDNYVGIVDFATTGEVSTSSKAPRSTFLVQRKAMSKLAKWCGELDAQLTLQLQDLTMRVGSAVKEEDIEVEVEPVSEHEPLLNVVEMIQDFEIPTTTVPKQLNISPTRMSRVARLKTGEDLPLSFYPGAKGFFFTVGTVKGLITSLKEEGGTDG